MLCATATRVTHPNEFNITFSLHTNGSLMVPIYSCNISTAWSASWHAGPGLVGVTSFSESSLSPSNCQKRDVPTTWCRQGQWCVKLRSPLSNICLCLFCFYLPFPFDTIYLYDVLCHVDLVQLAEPIMYLDCHVTVRAPQPFISKAEVRTLLFTVYYEYKTNYLLSLFWLYSSLDIHCYL